MKPFYTYAPLPLPGTGSRPHALFVDRWGTLLEPPRKVGPRLGDASFTPGALDGLFRAVQAGWTLYLIGNEEGVASGRWPEPQWLAFEGELLSHMTGLGIPVRRNYACLEHPLLGKGKRRRDSVFLLPNTGAMYHAAQEDGIELPESWVIGDSTLELSAGWRAGCRVAGVRTGQGLADARVAVEPEFVGDDLAGALGEILAVERLLRR